MTNPAIDPLREGLVMSLEVHLGARGNILMPDASSIPKVVLDYPAINDTELKFVQDHKDLNTVRQSQEHVRERVKDGVKDRNQGEKSN